MAQAVFHRRIAERGLSGQVAVASAATSSRARGEPADPRALRLAQARGYTHIDAVRSRSLTPQLLAEQDLVLVMDERNLSELAQRWPGQPAGKVDLLLRHAGLPAPHEVPDPYYGGSQGFEHVLNLLEASVDGVLARVIGAAGPRSPAHTAAP